MLSNAPSMNLPLTFYKTHPPPQQIITNPSLLLLHNPSSVQELDRSKGRKKSMEKQPQRTLSHTLSLAEPVGFLFFNTLLIWLTRLQKLSLRLLSHKLANNETNRVIKSRDTQLIRREDVELAMACMGIGCNKKGEQLKECMGLDELSNMFVEKEPSLEEVRVAFGVFDENSDGFIDAEELQRLIANLGLGHGLGFGDFEQMIDVHDDDGDGRIDFDEFVKFMESSFY